MSNAGFDYALGGLRSGAGLAALESARRQDKADLAAAQQAAQGQAIGAMVGLGTRGGLGVYDARKAKHEEEHPGEEYGVLADIQRLFGD